MAQIGQRLRIVRQLSWAGRDDGAPILNGVPLMNQEATLPSRWLAGLIGLVSVLTIAAMAHHPVAHGEDLAARLASMARVAPLAAGVHGGLITLLLTLLWLLGEATRQLVLLAPLRRAGTLAWSIGAVLQTLAALVNSTAPMLQASVPAASVPYCRRWPPWSTASPYPVSRPPSAIPARQRSSCCSSAGS